ncbi:hypothetical protein B0H19DRAFT_1258865 [Mycena capillaripes]|nr:hypothetical protein B0H19DRAFT_1258865 [Mycena capillaripes]
MPAPLCLESGFPNPTSPLVTFSPPGSPLVIEMPQRLFSCSVASVYLRRTRSARSFASLRMRHEISYPRCGPTSRASVECPSSLSLRRCTDDMFRSRQLAKHSAPQCQYVQHRIRELGPTPLTVCSSAISLAMCDMLGARSGDLRPAKYDSEPFWPSCARSPFASQASRGRLATTFSSTAARTTESTSSDDPHTSTLSIPASDSVHRHAQRGRQHELEHASGSHARRRSNRPRPCDGARVPPLCAACPALTLRFPAERQRAGPHHHRQQRHDPLVPPLRHGVRADAAMAVMLINSFRHDYSQAYLCADMIVGGLYYRAQIGFLTAGSTTSCTSASRRSQRIAAHIFCLCAVMELPTFLLGASTLLRSNTLFTLILLATHILFHIVLPLS